MKIAILSVSKRGKELSSKLKTLLDEDPTIIKATTFHKNVKDNLAKIFNDNKNHNENHNNNHNGNDNDYDAIIGIMATGILIRNIADKIQDKTKDPAILGIDDNGKYVISLVSGHLGGANELAKKIAKLLNSEPVITTATDTNDKIGIDTLANTLFWEIINKKEILTFNKAILEEKPIKLFINTSQEDNIEYNSFIIDYLKNQRKNTLETMDLKNQDLSIKDIENKFFSYNSGHDECIEDDIDKKESEEYNNKHDKNNKEYWEKYKDSNALAIFDENKIFFKPRKLVLGLGARANVSKEKVMKCIEIAMKNLNLPIERIDSIATVEVKKDEKGILETVKEINKPLDIVSIEKIKNFQSQDISHSEFVQEKFDIPGVAEPAALIVAKDRGGDSKLIHKKIAIDGVTVAVAVSKET